jgi:hypothetical protein
MNWKEAETMRQPLRCLCILAILYMGMWCMNAAAAEIQGRSSTQFLWYNDVFDGSKRADLTEYLRISATNLDGDKKLSVQGYGRGVYDTKHSSDSDGRLYYLFADYRDLMNVADVKLGRQFVNVSAGSALMDGVEADFKHLGSAPVGLVVLGGRNVDFGDTGELTTHQYSAGATLYLADAEMTYFDVSYFRTYDHSDLARDILGGSYKQYLFDLVKLYANARYDLTAEVFNELLAGVKYFPTLDLMVTAEHYESYPTFDTTSIFSVFAVDKYKENIGRVDYTLASWVDVSGAYSQEEFGDGGRAKLYEVGLRFRPSTALTIGVFHDKRTGYPGDLTGYKGYVEYSKIGKWKASAGVDYDAYERDNMTGQETAKKYWAAGKYIFAKNYSGTIRVEDNVNVDYSKDMQGRLTFDVDF